MARPLTLRIVVVDGEHARFVQPDEDNALRTVGSIDSASAHRRSRDLGSDRPGRSFESGASARHALGQRHDLHAMEKAKFIRLVGEQINAASVRDEFDELLLVAPRARPARVAQGGGSLRRRRSWSARWTRIW